ncbi:MAG: RNase adapter RapZ [Pseudomonadota bacterium]|nr:RNase adapter RapZ [Pseudomonadota bacterium]
MASDLLLVTGLSGAGKSTVLNVLEDLQYEVVDNLPIRLLQAFVDGSKNGAKLAVGVDSRSRGFSAETFSAAVRSIQTTRHIRPKIIFLTCDSDVLHLRFTETRRRHPLAVDRPVTDGIALELQMMEPLKEQSNYTFDTTHLSIADLRQLIDGQFSVGTPAPITISVVSFAFRLGLPREADLVFDVRFLKNPHYVEHLRECTGLDEKVRDYISSDPAYTAFFDHMYEMLLPLLPLYRHEGKRYLTIAIGCTGGRHRSVMVAEYLGAQLVREQYEAMVRHRDLPL